MFGFGSSGILLACTTTAHSTWTVSARAYFQYCGEAPHPTFPKRPFVCSVFEGLQISLDSTKQHVIRLNNVAQFMEILLERLDNWVWRPVESSMPGPQGQNPENKERFAKNRNPKQVLEGLESTHQPILANDEEEVSGESDDGETIERDNERSMANFDPLVKPRISKPPIEKTRQREKKASSKMFGVNKFSDPFGDLVLGAEYRGISSGSSVSMLPF
jgi:hypothetical protein